MGFISLQPTLQKNPHLKQQTHSSLPPFSQTTPPIQKQTKKRSNQRRKMGRKSFKVEFDESPPDDFDPENPYKDPVAMLEMREHIVREKWIQIEKAKILRDRVRWCYRVEGVNHLQKCRRLVNDYLESTRGLGWNKDTRPPSLQGPKVETVVEEED